MFIKDINSYGIIKSNIMYQKNKEINNSQKIGDKINNLITKKQDQINISEEGMLKLKTRNLHEAEKLEKVQVEKQERLKEKLDLYKNVKETLIEVQNDIQNVIDNKLSNEETDKTQENIKEKISGVIDVIKEVEKENKDEINNENKYLENPIHKALESINVVTDSIKSRKAVGAAIGLMNEEISKIMSEIGKLEKEIDKLLGADGKSMEKNEISGDNKIKNQEKIIENINNDTEESQDAGNV